MEYGRFSPPEPYKGTDKPFSSEDDDVEIVPSNNRKEPQISKRKRDEAKVVEKEQKKKTAEKPSNRKKAIEKIANKRVINLKDKSKMPFISSPSGFSSNNFWKKKMDHHLKVIMKMTPEELQKRADLFNKAHAEGDRVSRNFELPLSQCQPRDPDCKVGWPENFDEKEFLRRIENGLPRNIFKETSKKSPSTSGEKAKRGRPKKDSVDEVLKKYPPLIEQIKRKEAREKELLKSKETHENNEQKKKDSTLDELLKKYSPSKEPAKKDIPEKSRKSSPKNDLLKKYSPIKEALKKDSCKNDSFKDLTPSLKISKPLTAETGVQTEKMEVDLPPFKSIDLKFPDMNNTWDLLIKRMKKEQENFKVLVENISELNKKIIEFRKSMINDLVAINNENSQNLSQKSI